MDFFNVYFFQYSFVGDHFQYLASIGIMALAGSGIGWVLVRFQLWGQIGGNAVCLALLLVLAILTWRQCGMYADNETLWRTTITKNPTSWLAHNNLGLLLEDDHKLAAAEEHFRIALTLRPGYSLALNNLGTISLTQNRYT